MSNICFLSLFLNIGQGAGLYDVSSDNLDLINPFISHDLTEFPTSNGRQRNYVRFEICYMYICV
jgi:hypothetical protein